MSPATIADFTISNSRDDNNERNWILPAELMEFNNNDSANNDMTAAVEDTFHRRNQEAEALEEKVCRFFLELNTTSAPPERYDLFNGVVFRVKSKNLALEIKSLELDLERLESTEVKVYTKLGEYNGTSATFDDPSEWEEVTLPPAFAVASAERKNLIIPTDEFKPIIMEPKESRLIYVAFPSDTPLVKSDNQEDLNFDDMSADGEQLKTYVGFGVSGGSDYFSIANTVENRPFHGIIHYETKTTCEDQRDSFVMDLPYFVDTRETPAGVTSAANSEISLAITHAMSRDAKLIRMQNIGSLRYQIQSTETNVIPYTGACPFNWEECSKLVVSVHFGHDDRLNPGIARFEILKYANDFNVSTYPFDLGYVGKMPLSLDYYISLVGAPKSFELDEAQEEYYGAQTAKFLADVTGEDILAAGLTPGKRNAPITSADYSSRSASGLRDDGRRNLQSTSAKVHTSIYGAFPAWPTPQHALADRGVDSMATVEILQSAFDENGTLYMQYLKDGLLRPGPIHEDRRAAFFAGVLGTDAELDESSLWMPTSAPTIAPTMDPDAEEEVWGMPASTLQILAMLALVIGALCMIATGVLEYQNRQEEKEKLKRNARAAQRKVDKLRAEQYRRIAEKKKRIQNGLSADDDDSLYEPMLS